MNSDVLTEDWNSPDAKFHFVQTKRGNRNVTQVYAYYEKPAKDNEINTDQQNILNEKGKGKQKASSVNKRHASAE